MPLPAVAGSRVQVLEAPRQLPGVCMLCGASRNDDRKYVDIGKDIEFVGVIYFCTFCMTEIANTLGCLMPEQAKALEDELDAARQRILEFNEKDKILNGAIDALRSTGLFSGTDLTGVISSRPVDSVQDVPALSRNASGNKSESTKPTDDATEASNEQGPDDVSATRNDEFKLDFL